MSAANLAEKGSWPVAGGWMDQAASFVDAVEICWAEKARWRANLIKSDGNQ